MSQTNPDSVPIPPARLALSIGDGIAPGDFPRTWTEALMRAASNVENGIWHVDEAGVALFQSYADLWRESLAIAEGLRCQGFNPGDRLLIQAASSRDTLPSIWGCLAAGGSASLVSTQESFGRSSAGASQVNWAEVSEATHVLTMSANAPANSSTFIATHRVVALDELRQSPVGECHPREPDDIALVLFTSGSTGLPKAVPLRDRNLLAYGHGMSQANGFRSDDVVLNWLGLDHVGAISMMHGLAVFLGCTQVHAATVYVVQQMSRWLDLIDRFRVTIGWSPNFAYRLIVDRLDMADSFPRDLSHVKYLINGGEQVHLATVEAFESTFASIGLKSGTVRPCYGMSESCSAISASDEVSLHRRKGRPVTEVGPPIAGAAIRVTDPDGCVVSEAEEGRIELSGPSVFEGYLGASGRESFTSDGWFQTGDVGYLEEGRLYITGRVRETVLIHGLHIPCIEIEEAIASLTSIEPTAVVACSVVREKGEPEEIAIFFSPKLSVQDHRSIVREIRQRVLQRFGQNPRFLVAIKPDQFPRTGIGKIMRSKLKKEFEHGLWDACLCEPLVKAPVTELLNLVWAVEPALSRLEALDADDPGMLWINLRSNQTADRHLEQQLQRQGCALWEAIAGNEYRDVAPTISILRADSVEDWSRLAAKVLAAGYTRVHLLHQLSFESDSPLRSIRLLLYSVVALAQGWDFHFHSLVLSLMTPGSTGTDDDNHWLSETARTLAYTIPEEFPHMRLFAVETDREFSSTLRLARQHRWLASQLISPTQAIGIDLEHCLALQWRRGKCYRRTITSFRNIQLEELTNKEIELSPLAVTIDADRYRRESLAEGHRVSSKPALLLGRAGRVGSSVQSIRTGMKVVARWPENFDLFAQMIKVDESDVVEFGVQGSVEEILANASDQNASGHFRDEAIFEEDSSHRPAPISREERHPRRVAFTSSRENLRVDPLSDVDLFPAEWGSVDESAIGNSSMNFPVTSRKQTSLMCDRHPGASLPLQTATQARISTPPFHVVSANLLRHAEELIAKGRDAGPVILIHDDGAPVCCSPCRWRSDGAYLIVGGLGGLGRFLASQLAAAGVGGLVLVGTHAPSDEEAVFLESLGKKGADVRYRRVDIRSREQVRELFDFIAGLGLPLRGIFHLAGLLHHAPLRRFSPSEWERTQAAKVDGSWWLHELSISFDLDVFVLFSSLEALLPRPGFVGYGVANAFLHGLASWRRERGLPALAIAWGGFPSIGMLADMSSDSPNTSSMHFVSDPFRLLDTITHLTSVGAIVATACSVSSKPGDAMTVAATLEERLRLLPHADTVVPLQNEQNLKAAMRDGTPEERIAFLSSLVDDALFRTLSRAIVLSRDQNLLDLGLDSIQAVWFVHALGKSIGHRLPIQLLANCATVADLINAISERIEGLDKS